VARSKRLLLGILLGAGLLLVPVAGAPFAAAGNPCYHGFDVPPLTVGTGSDVKTQDCAFEPTITVVKTGDTVTFRNDTNLPHLVTGANAEWGDRDIQVAPGSSVEYAFAEPGVYPYACSFHPGMTGAIVVGDGGAALAATVAAVASGEGGEPIVQGAATASTAPAVTDEASPIVVAVAGALVAVALGLAVVALAARGRARRDPAPVAGTPEPVTR
jgi:plastocyanin